MSERKTASSSLSGTRASDQASRGRTNPKEGEVANNSNKAPAFHFSQEGRPKRWIWRKKMGKWGNGVRGFQERLCDQCKLAWLKNEKIRGRL